MDAFERELVARLRRAEPEVPPAVDAAILGAAAEAAGQFRRRRRLRLVRVDAGAVDRSRATLKPSIPPVGLLGIPIRDELELEMETGGVDPAVAEGS